MLVWGMSSDFERAVRQYQIGETQDFCPESLGQELSQSITIPMSNQQLEDIHQVVGDQRGEQTLTP